MTATVEFPLGCEIKVNSNLLPINLKGTKKSPAKVSPPNLNKDGKFNVMNGVVNKVELIYTGASSVSFHGVKHSSSSVLSAEL